MFLYISYIFLFYCIDYVMGLDFITNDNVIFSGREAKYLRAYPIISRLIWFLRMQRKHVAIGFIR